MIWTGTMLSLGTREELAWAAGFYEGEGGCYESGGALCARVTQTGTLTEPPDSLVRFQRITGSIGVIVSTHEKPRLGKKPLWEWRLAGFEKSQAIVAMLWPWLCEKKRTQATRSLTAARQREQSRFRQMSLIPRRKMPKKVGQRGDSGRA